MKPIRLCLALVLVLTACSKEVAPPVKAERPALTQVVGVRAGTGSNLYSGEVHARHEIDLGFRLNGKIVERLVDAGARVKRGQILARLDPADAGLQAGASQAQFQLAGHELQRYRELHSRGFISQSALDAKQAAFDSASAQAGLTHNQTEYTTLRAEHDGVVAATWADAGQVVAAGQPVLRLAQEGEMEVAIAIPEAQFALHKVGDTAQIRLLDDTLLAGRLRELSPQADAVSRTYAARVAFVAPQAALGMTARVFFNTQQDSELVIPVSAIYQQGKQTAVWIVAADRRVSLRPVAIASYRDEGAVISSGLSAGERIVSAGVHRLSQGEIIHIIQDVTSGSAQ